MEATGLRAGIELYGTELRYAELEPYGTRHRLLRLGRCDFDFDVADEILKGSNRQHLSTVAEALRDVFSDSTVLRIHVTLHPPACPTFFTPLPTGLDAYAQEQHLQEEAALLLHPDKPHLLHLTTDPVSQGTMPNNTRVEWVHVLALETTAKAQFDHLMKALPNRSYRLTSSMHAVSKAAARILAQDANDAAASATPYALVVGWYPSHTEFTLCHHGTWQQSYYAETKTTIDAAFFGLDLLRRLEIKYASVGHLFVYGQEHNLKAFAPLETALPCAAQFLDLHQLVTLDAANAQAIREGETYIPCVAGAL